MWGAPFGVAVALFAPDLVEFVLGERWRPAVGVIQVFGLIAAADQFGFNWDAYFRAAARTRPIAVVSIVNMTVFFAVTVPLLFAEGLDGYAAGMAILTVASIAGRTYFLGKMFAGLAFARHAARAIAPVVPATAAVLSMRLLESGSRALWMAIAEAVLFLAITAAATFMLERPLIREIASYLRRPSAGDLAPV
jgi:lipopolysaccharide exporter